jgi:undecaprenyl-diphosphatase
VSAAPAVTGKDPREQIDEKVIATPPTRRKRAANFQYAVLGASILFVALAVAAKFIPYFSFDLKVTRAIQAYKGGAFHGLMATLSWIGFVPQVDILGAAAVLLLFLLGLKWEAISTCFAALGIVVGSAIKMIVGRPRPTADLVEVSRVISASSFPSGHVVMITTFAGFLLFLAFTLLKPSLGRTLLLIVLGLMIGLMGMSRIYLGHHWFSDVIGAYVLGGLWLALTVKFYRWGKQRFFVDQPVAPDNADASGNRRAEAK